MRTVHLQMNDNYKGTASAVLFLLMHLCLYIYIYLSMFMYLFIYLSMYVCMYHCLCTYLCIYLDLCIYYVKSVSLNTQEGYKVWYN